MNKSLLSFESKKLLKRVLIFVIGLVVIYFVGGIFLNYYCYNRNWVPLNKSWPWETFSKAATRARTTINENVRSLLIKYMVYCQVLPIGLYIMGFIFALGEMKKTAPDSEKERRGLKGTAEWGKEKDYKGVYVFDWEPYENLPPVILGQTYDAVMDGSDPQYITTEKFGSQVVGCDPTKINIMTMGGIGSLKGVSTIVPTLLSYKDSAIVYDPAKENFNITAGYRQKLGRVQYFDPTDMDSTLHFNALDWIRRDRNYITADIDNICAILIPTTNEKEKFFSQNARNLLSIYIAYVILFFPKEKQNLKEVTNLITILNKESRFHHKSVKARIAELQRQLQKTKSRKKLEDITREIKYWDSYLNSLDFNDKQALDEDWKKERSGSMVAFVNRLQNDIRLALDHIDHEDPDSKWKSVLLERAFATASKMKVTAAAEQTIAGIEGEITSNMTFFSEDGIARLTRDTTFSIEDINRKKDPISLYLCIPNADTERCKTFVRLFVSCVVKQLSADYTLKRTHHTLVILDEFPQLGRIDELLLAVPFVRKYGISFLMIFQSIAQLESEKCYGKTDTRNLRANSRILDIKQINDISDAKWVSDQLGKRTVILQNESQSVKKGGDSNGKTYSISAESRSLLNETEVTQLPSEEGIIIIGNNKPLRIKKMQYFLHPYFQMLANIPYDGEKEVKITQEILKEKNEEEDDIIDIPKTAIVSPDPAASAPDPEGTLFDEPNTNNNDNEDDNPEGVVKRKRGKNKKQINSLDDIKWD